MEQKWMYDNDIATLLSLCSAYTNAQLYKTALNLYGDIIQTPELHSQLSEEQIEYVYMNKRFCESPLYGSSGAKDHFVFRYIHYFFLKRFGKRRFSFIREEDLLEFNSFLRYKNGI
ncbi:MAG: hypothetical protein IKO75_00235 [Bacteroidales bacterium]|nr:hypothetical protein [Bacteroidales bacterium]